MKETERLSTGTTTVGIVVKDAVILAADRRATAGTLIVDKKIDKVVPVAETIAVTTSGSVSDLQLLVKYLRAELKLKQLQTGRNNTVKESAHLLSAYTYNILRSSYGVCHWLLGGYDKAPSLYDIYPDGSLTEMKDYSTSGSGSVIAYGVLEDAYKPNMTVEEGVQVALRAVNAALQRDSASGNGVTVYVIDKNGMRLQVSKETAMNILK